MWNFIGPPKPTIVLGTMSGRLPRSVRGSWWFWPASRYSGSGGPSHADLKPFGGLPDRQAQALPREPEPVGRQTLRRIKRKLGPQGHRQGGVAHPCEVPRILGRLRLQSEGAG